MIKLLLSLAIAAFAQEALPPVLPPAMYRDFSGGYVDSVEPTNLAPNESPNAQDIVIDDPNGSMKPRAGITRCGNTPSGNAPTGLYQYVRSDGTKRLIVTDNTTVWETRDCVSFTTIKNSGLSSSANLSFSTIRDKVWFVNGSTFPFTWDGTNAAILDGRANTPNPTPPKCAYLEFWKERVWCAKTSGEPSALYFSAITDNNGNDVDPSTGSLSWPAANVFYVNNNGGSAIYGLKSYRDRLYVFKDNGIWEIQFNSEFDNAVRKTYSSVGSRFNTSIVEIDGLLYFTGKDGIYVFDGEQSVRLSGPIDNKFRALNQPQISTQYKIWTTQSDFNGGTLSSTTANITPGSVVLSSASALITNGGFESGALSPFTCDTGSAHATCTASNSSPYTGSYSLRALYGTNGPRADCGLVFTYYIFDVSGSTLTTGSINVSDGAQSIDISAYTGQIIRFKFFGAQTPLYEDIAVWSGTFTAVGPNLTWNQTTQSNSTGDNLCGWLKLDDFTNAVYLASGTWTSDVYSFVSISSWTAFDANCTSNGGSCSYEIRTGTNSGAALSHSFTAITPGSLINSTSDQVSVQVRASLIAPADLTASPALLDVTVSNTAGGTAANQLFAAGWKNRLWVSASSGTSTTNNLALVKSRLPSNAWIPYSLQIGPMTQFNDAFYAGASTCSAIYRLDYGTNDDGRAIPWYWETKEELWGLPNNKKYLLEMNADFKKDSADSVYLGFSRNYGSSWTDKLINMNGSGRGSATKYVSGGNAFSYRLRIYDTTIDESATITGITGRAKAHNIRE